MQAVSPASLCVTCPSLLQNTAMEWQLLLPGEWKILFWSSRSNQAHSPATKIEERESYTSNRDHLYQARDHLMDTDFVHRNSSAVWTAAELIFGTGPQTWNETYSTGPLLSSGDQSTEHSCYVSQSEICSFTTEGSNSISLPCLLQFFSIYEPNTLEADQPKKRTPLKPTS